MIEIYKCESCGNIFMVMHNSGIKPFCCGKTMEKLNAKTAEEGGEKHLPVFTAYDNEIEVKVGSVPHPMLPEHHIQWIALETNKGVQIRYLNQLDGRAYAKFRINPDERFIAVYEYCNIHGLWKTRA